MVILSNANNFSALDIIYNSIDILLKDDIVEASTKKEFPNNSQLKKI